ncbi:putative receptor-like protein 12-like [Capsicum annuum]|nr:putative receptor-like protein 12-like [Capsicum annuum]
MAMEQQFDGWFETHYQNSPGLVNNFDTGGPSNGTMNLKNFNSSGPQYPSSVEAIDSNNDVQGELDSDEPSQYESSDDDQSSDDEDDDNNDKNINGESTPVSVYTGNHSSIAIPYLDHTEESPEELRCMVNEDCFRASLWNQNNPEHIKLGGNVQKVSAKGKKCSCGKWRNLHMPCSHAIKFCGIRGIAPKDYVSKYYGTKYYKRTYSETFTPVGQQAYRPPAPFRLIANIEYLETSRVDSGTRLKNDMDIALDCMARKCGICKQTGHIKARCPRRN